MDLRVVARSDGANVFLSLDKPPVDPAWTFVFDLPKDSRLGLNERGGVDVTDSSGKIHATIAPPYAVDSTPDEFTGSGRMTTKLHYELGTTATGRPTVTTRLDDLDWLATAIYPVYVDPSITLVGPGTSANGDAHVNRGNPNFNYANYQRPDAPGYYEMWLGESPSDSTYYNAALIKFDVSTLGWTGERLLDWTGSGADIRIYGTNAHHDVTWLASSTGSVSQALRYDPWGNPRSSVPSGYSPFRFQGSFYDPRQTCRGSSPAGMRPPLARSLARTACSASRRIRRHGTCMPMGQGTHLASGIPTGRWR